ncbi:MAG TPA: ABC transporter permease [Puia sp.]|nr:ABC transporter permease [Puia sp.]
MLLNYIKMAFRNLKNHKSYGFLNIFGLAVGIACAGLIFLWVEDELRWDNVHVNRDRIYIVKTNDREDAGMFTHSSTPGPLAPSLAVIPGVAATCRSTEGMNDVMFRYGNASVNAGGRYVEPSFFNLFTLPFVEGDASHAFSQLHSLVITESAAKKFFGNEKNVLGKSVSMDGKQDYIVSGVVKDLPANSSIQFEWLAPFEVFFANRDDLHQWNNFGLTTYVELKPGADVDAINKRLLEKNYDFTTQRLETDPSSVHVFLFGMKYWRLYDQFANGKMTGGGRIQYVRLFTAIAWIILFIACINFMNLATARSERRSREVGVRKVMGAGKKSLVAQFLGEAMLMTLLSTFLAVILLVAALPAFNLLVGKNLSPELNNPIHMIALLVLTLICGLAAGSYPALYLSSFNPVFVLKGIKARAGGASLVRKGLVVLQFTASIALIIGTILVYQQIRLAKQRDLGFNRNNLVEIALQGNAMKNFEVIRQELLKEGIAVNAALADHALLFNGNNTSGISWPGKRPDSKVVISQRVVSPEFISTMGIRIISGRDFRSTDTVGTADMEALMKAKMDLPVMHVLVTASMERLMGGNAIGKKLQERGNFVMNMVVDGVVDDYVYGDMFGHGDPVVFYCVPNQTDRMYVRLMNGNDPEQAMAKMQAVFAKYNPGYPFQFVFVDDQFNNLFVGETLISKLSEIFASLAIIISCIGLFGLAAYTAERRTKEVGIRKVLGASEFRITKLLTTDFIQLVLLSCLLAFPLAGWIMHSWLMNYAMRISIHWWVFLLAAVVSILVALITVGSQAIRAALANPVRSLRSE